MVTRRLAQIATSDDDEDEAPKQESLEAKQQRKRKRMKLQEYEDEEAEVVVEEEDEEKKKNQRNPPTSDAEEEQDAPLEDAKPVGESIRVSGKGRGRKRHFHCFEFDGNQYALEDPVLLVPEGEDQKPYVAIIKDIAQSVNGSIMVTGQWFYRPEEAEKKGGGSWQSCDARELFYSFHRDDVPAESVMHKCVVHFVPIHKQLPNRKQHPGFIVRKVYDTVERKLWKLTDKDYEDGKQQEIDELVQKTLERLGELPDIETDEALADQEDLTKNKRMMRKKSISPLDVSKEETARKSDQPLKPDTPLSCVNNASEHYRILVGFNALTGDTHRDKGLEKLLQSVQYMFDNNGSMKNEEKVNDNSDDIKNGSSNRGSESANEYKDKVQKSSKPLIWPGVAVSAVAALEKASHDALSSDYQKYNQKLRQLVFNLRNNAFLARRLLNGELEPSKILNMTPAELKEGLTAEEITKTEPEESEQMQMTDALCSVCSERKAGVRDIIRAGHFDRYKLECIACGHSWYASRDAVSVLTSDPSDSFLF
ncbi:uncharacterized protein LOC130715838 [Lotus japonicus]|uniref:uncharacterized protein LOC130715838 n=1 Tax=Lotus japonicus TaxID=34305 RepID=UPI00258E7112|nr:uncharacterized protein LOC130715838 [Lotus japonicus]